LDPRIRIDPRRWVIDHDNDVFLMWAGNARDEASNQHDFLFWWKGTPMALSMREEWYGKTTLTWHLGLLHCPEHLRSEYDEMIQVLKEALRVYGGGFAPDLGVSPIEVQFDFC
jgi:hypothetical protein